MFDRKSLKKALIGSAALMGGNLLLPASALAASCPSTILGNALSAEICDFNAGSSVTVASGGVVGGISQINHTPINSYIINNGTISNDGIIDEDKAFGINIYSSSLSNGLINNGTVIAMADSGIAINRSSTVSGGVSNTGIIASGINFGFQLDDNSVVNGNIANSGSIISSSINNPALLIRDNSIVNGNVINSGLIHASGEGAGFYMNESFINGNITNSGTISGGIGFSLRDATNITGDIINSGAIRGAIDNGIAIVNSVVIEGDIINSGAISGNVNGISVSNADNTISGNIINQAGATISGDVGIYVDNGSTINGAINNYGTITGSTNSIYVEAGSTIANINIYDGSVINGAINAVNSNVNFSGGQIIGAISVDSFNINSGVTFTKNQAITAQGAVVNAGTVAIGSTAQTITGNYTQLAGGTLRINAQDTTTYGQLAATGAVDLTASGKIDVVINGTNIKTGNRLNNVISGNTLAIPTGGFSVTDNSRLLSFTAALNDGNNGVNLLAVDDASTSVSQSSAASGNRGSAGAAAKLDEIIALNQSGDAQNIISALNNLGSDQQIANAANQTTPALTGETNSATINTMNNALRIVQVRQQSTAGFSSGEDFYAKNNLWMKTFGSWGKQGNKDGVVGYNSNTYGVIAGTDKAIDKKTRAGVAVSYSNSKFTSNNNDNRVNVDSFLGIAYGSYKLDDNIEANAQVSVGYNSSQSSRNIDFGGLNRTAKGGYGGWNLQAGSGISRLVKLDSKTIIAPQFRVDYFTVGNQSYNERGAGALNLHVASQRQDQLIPAVEVAADHKLTPKFSLALNAGLGYDLLNGASTVSASFEGGGGKFITQGLEPSPWIVNSGAGLTWKRSNEVDLTARYDRRDRGSYVNQTVSVKLRVMF